MSTHTFPERSSRVDQVRLLDLVRAWPYKDVTNDSALQFCVGFLCACSRSVYVTLGDNLLPLSFFSRASGEILRIFPEFHGLRPTFRHCTISAGSYIVGVYISARYATARMLQWYVAVHMPDNGARFFDAKT